jgi:hypothetical protein
LAQAGHLLDQFVLVLVRVRLREGQASAMFPAV